MDVARTDASGMNYSLTTSERSASTPRPFSRKRSLARSREMEFLGWVGTALVIVAYIPQIHHLSVEKCAWGSSITTWLIWLLASTLLLTYCVLRSDSMFT